MTSADVTAVEVRTAVIIGGASGLEPTIEVRKVAPSIVSPTSVVHDVFEVMGDGSVAAPGGTWHHDPERAGGLLRVVRLAPVPPGGAPGHLHASPTVDYGIVVSGGAWLLVEGDRVYLGAGDSFLLRGADHAWFNEATDDCVLAVTLITPAVIGTTS